MGDSADRYYATLAVDYAATIRQLVPRYDEMLEAIAAQVRLALTDTPVRDRTGTTSDDTRDDTAPRPAHGAEAPAILDLGAGSGEVCALLLERFPEVSVTAVEPSEAMLAALRQRLAPWTDRVRVGRADALRFTATHRFEAIVSNLVLHNLGSRDKRKALRHVQSMLVQGGVFVWGDMILRPDPRVQRDVNAERARLARAAGCPPELIEENFRKERQDDSPWTVYETLTVSRRAGFRDVDCVWTAGAFAVFAMRRRGRPRPVTGDET